MCIPYSLQYIPNSKNIIIYDQGKLINHTPYYITRALHIAYTVRNKAIKLSLIL